GIIMFAALILVPIVTFFHTGGAGDTVAEIRSVDPDMFNIFKGTSVLGIISLFAWGLGYFGQPHIIVRFMAINSVKEIKRARRIGMGWMILSAVGAVLTGLGGIAYYHQRGMTLKDPETIFIQLGNILFHPIITGFLISAILAAIMSTISSQLLVTSSSLVEDLYKSMFRRSASDKELVFLGRLAVLAVSIVALVLAWEKNNTILGLVSYAWAGFGASFGPVVLLSLFWKRMTKWGALAGMIVGAATVIIWANAGLSDFLYEMIPGFAASLLSVFFVSILTQAPSQAVTDQFNDYQDTMSQ
ncbi:sodium:solute symporter family transporter, partial [Kribbella sp. NPDC055071]